MTNKLELPDNIVIEGELFDRLERMAYTSNLKIIAIPVMSKARIVSLGLHRRLQAISQIFSSVFNYMPSNLSSNV